MNNNLNLNPGFINSSPLSSAAPPLQASTLDPNSSQVRDIHELSKDILSQQTLETELENDDYSAQSLTEEGVESSFYDELSDDIFESAFEEEEEWQSELEVSQIEGSEGQLEVSKGVKQELSGNEKTSLGVVEEVESKSLEGIKSEESNRLSSTIKQLEQVPNYKNIYFEDRVNSFGQIVEQLKELREETPENRAWIQRILQEIQEAVDKGTLLISDGKGNFRPLTAAEWNALKEKLPEIFLLFFDAPIVSVKTDKGEETEKKSKLVVDDKVLQVKQPGQPIAPVKKRPLDREEEGHKRIVQSSFLIGQILKEIFASGIKRLDAKKMEEKTEEMFQDILSREIQKFEGMKREIHRLVLKASAFSKTFKERFVNNGIDGIPQEIVNDLKITGGNVVSLGSKKFKLF